MKKKYKILEEWGFIWINSKKVYAKQVKLHGTDKEQIITITRQEVMLYSAWKLEKVILPKLMQVAAKRLLKGD